jgi:hypothetical protein
MSIHAVAHVLRAGFHGRQAALDFREWWAPGSIDTGIRFSQQALEAWRVRKQKAVQVILARDVHNRRHRPAILGDDDR